GAKVAVLRAALVGDLLWLAIVGVVFAGIGAFYYLRVIKVMYFEQPAGEPIVVRGGALQAVFAVTALALLGLGLAWNPIMAWCQAGFPRDPAVVGVSCAVVGAFYCRPVIRVVYFGRRAGGPFVVRGGALQAVFAVTAPALLGLSLAWNPTMAWCQAAFA